MKYFIYTRKSTDSEERQILSIEAQLAELREFAAKEKLEIVASLCEAQTAKEPVKNVGSNFILARSGLFLKELNKIISYVSIILKPKYSNNIMLSKYGK